jgi:hypothetical protein
MLKKQVIPMPGTGGSTLTSCEAKYMIQCRAAAHTVGLKKLRVPQKAGDFLTRQATISFSRRALLLWVKIRRRITKSLC